LDATFAGRPRPWRSVPRAPAISAVYGFRDSASSATSFDHVSRASRTFAGPAMGPGGAPRRQRPGVWPAGRIPGHAQRARETVPPGAGCPGPRSRRGGTGERQPPQAGGRGSLAKAPLHGRQRGGRRFVALRNPHIHPAQLRWRPSLRTVRSLEHGEQLGLQQVGKQPDLVQGRSCPGARSGNSPGLARRASVKGFPPLRSPKSSASRRVFGKLARTV